MVSTELRMIQCSIEHEWVAGQGYGQPPQNGYGAPPQNEYGRGEQQVSYGGAAAGRKKALICACNYK